MAAATAIITEQSPFIVRTSFTAAAGHRAAWPTGRRKNGIKKVVTLVSDYGPGIDAEKAFTETLHGKAGGQVENLRVPLRQPGFRALPAEGRRRQARRAVRLRAVGRRRAVHEAVRRARPRQERHQADRPTGDVTDDDLLNDMGDVALGAITTHHYSAAHDSPENKAFVEAFKKANNGMRPNFMAVGGYDGMHLIYEALKKTNGARAAQALVDAMKGMSWTSPRGPISIDPETRDIVQNIYVRKVESSGRRALQCRVRDDRRTSRTR